MGNLTAVTSPPPKCRKCVARRNTWEKWTGKTCKAPCKTFTTSNDHHLRHTPRSEGGGRAGPSCRLERPARRPRPPSPPPSPSPSRAASSFPFSSLSARQQSAASDAHLLRVINFEISYAQKDCKNRNWAKELRESFPFEIQDKEGTSRITLTRSHHNEQIQVEALLPSAVDEVVKNGEQQDQAEDGKHQSDTRGVGGVPNQYCIPLLVRIHKGMTSCLKITCSSYPMELVIESLEFGLSDQSGGSLSGATMFSSDIPEELQEAFYPYLTSRGISTDFTDFIHAYMINKECHEYLSWLRKLKGLIKS